MAKSRRRGDQLGIPIAKTVNANWYSVALTKKED
jgi:hypothetical protein